jgi:3-deoxy-D-manno-octulosonic-acid transferase
VNGRLSERSFHRYKLVRGFISRVVNCLSLALMQSEADAARLRALGLEVGRVLVSGNVKFDAVVEDFVSELTAQLRERFQLNDEHPLIVAASTHAPEERLVIEAYRKLCAQSSASKPRLLIAPRHPERFAEVASLLDASGFRWTRRSSVASEFDSSCDIILLDSIGELRAVYSLAALVFVGGSVAPVGGHNVLEPAAAGTCIITGPHTLNFAAVMRALLDEQAIVQLPLLPLTEFPSALAQAFGELLADEERRRRFSERAKNVLEQNRGATTRTLRMLAPLLSATPDRSAHGRTPSAEARSTLSS